ncbi:hypothetical protein K1S81_26055 [Klebsiella pneumoniae]|nr:hypothetical protein [Klebsiella pneumoniae]MCA5482920.1 hypothetical protein [Klebsiella pneumoniae]MCA5541682.1 hypothetical protein [Klebsiella pneumoniae]
MLRQSDIAAAFRESILRSSKGFQYLHTRDFVTALRRRGIHLSEVEANSWIAREKTYFVDSALDHSKKPTVDNGRDGTRADCRANQSGFSRSEGAGESRWPPPGND